MFAPWALHLWKDIMGRWKELGDAWEHTLDHKNALGRGCFIREEPEQTDIRMAREGLDKCAALMAGGDYDVVILDELTIALHYGLLTVREVLEALDRRHPSVEIVITGRYAPQELIDRADLVTEMREIKHYYRQGVRSRDGIDK